LYDGRDSVELSKLARDVGLLMLEKDKGEKNEVFASIVALKWLWIIIVLLIIGFIFILTRKPVEIHKQNN
jgi:protein SCO1/2